jgi:hypothetical protein
MLERQLLASLAEIQRNKVGAAVAPAAPPAAAPVASPSPAQTEHRNGNGGNPNGKSGSPPNGANGSAPYVPPSAGGSPLIKIPMDVAFGEILTFMSEGLRTRNEQWTDQARQDFVCTILIGAQKEGWLSVWQRGGAK